MATISPVGWNDFQHYKDRSPSWIKLHRKYLDDYSFHSMQDASKALAPMLWLLASEYDGGQIPFDIDMLAFRLRTAKEKLSISLKELIDKGFFELEQGASELLAKCLPREEKRRERVREEREEESMSGKPDDDAEKVLAHLNAKANRSYRPVKANLDMIRARIKEGATVGDLKAVIDLKVRQWAKDPKMSPYLRPDTLFNAKKFAQYVGQLNTAIPIAERSIEGFLATFDAIPDDGLTLDMEHDHA